MNRIEIIEREDANVVIAPLYDAVHQKLGLIPNMVKALGNSSAALKSYLNQSAAVAGGVLRPSTREKIALLVAEYNECDYCLSAHTAIGGLLKIPSDELSDAREGKSGNAKEQAILKLTHEVLHTRGAVSEETFTEVKNSGVTDEEAIEVVANVAENMFTNYFNRFADTEIDFPKVESGACVV